MSGDGAPAPLLVRDTLALLFRHRIRLGVAFLLPVAVAAVASLLAVPLYRASAVLVVRPGPEYVYRSEVAGAGAASVTFDRSEIGKAELAILGSRDLHEAVVRQVGIGRLYPRLADAYGPSLLVRLGLARRPAPEVVAARRAAAAAQDLERQLDVELEKDSSVIRVGFRHRDSHLAVEALDALLTQYLAKRKAVYLQPRVMLATSEVESSRAGMERAERAVERYRRDHHIYDFADQRADLLRQRADLEAQTGSLLGRAAELERLASTLGRDEGRLGRDSVLYRDSGNDPAVATARTRVVEAQSRLKAALNRYAESGPVVADARQQVADASDVLRQAEANHAAVVRVGRSGTYESIQLDAVRAAAELDANKAKRIALAARIGTIEQQLDEMGRAEHQYNDIVRDAKLAEDRYALFVRKLDEARQVEDLEQDRASSVRIVQPPSVPTEPKRLQPLILEAGLLLGLVAAAAVAALTALTRSGFLTPEQLERSAGLPVLAVLNHRPSAGEER